MSKRELEIARDGKRESEQKIAREIVRGKVNKRKKDGGGQEIFRARVKEQEMVKEWKK